MTTTGWVSLLTSPSEFGSAGAEIAPLVDLRLELLAPTDTVHWPCDCADGAGRDSQRARRDQHLHDIETYFHVFS